MPYETNLPRGVSTIAEEVFIEFAQQALSGLTDFRWSPNADVTKVYVASEESDFEQERYPQVRVSTGDMADYQGAIDRLVAWDLNVQSYTHVDQAFVTFSGYAGLQTEARDLADFLKMEMIRARETFGRLGVFGLRQISSAKPRPTEGGSTTDSVFMASVTAAFMFVHRRTDTERELQLWMEADVTVRIDEAVDPETAPGVPPVLVSANQSGPHALELVFSEAVAPYMPAGLSVETTLASGATADAGATVRRDMTNFSRLFVTTDHPCSPSRPLVLRYAGDPAGDLCDFTEQTAVVAFERDLRETP